MDSKEESFRIAYNTFDTILLEKAKPEIKHLLSSVRKSIYLRDNQQRLTPISIFGAICPDQFFFEFLSVVNRRIGTQVF